MYKPAGTASAVSPGPTIQNVGRPGTRSLPRTIATLDHQKKLTASSGFVKYP